MTAVSHVDLLRRVPLFSALTDAQAQAMAAGVSKARYRRGDILMQQGDKSRTLCILLNGRARVIKRHRNGKEVILATLTQGDCIGEMSVIDNMPHSASVQAVVQTDVIKLDAASFASCLPEKGSMAEAVLRGLTQRLRRADRNIASLALMDVYGRVAKVLLESATRGPDGKWMVQEKISRQDIANMVGASREMVSRVMGYLAERDCIVLMEDGGIQIRNHMVNIV